MKYSLLSKTILFASLVYAHQVWAEMTWTDSDTGITWTYSVRDDMVQLDRGAVTNTFSGSLVIPEEIGGKPVSIVGCNTFLGYSKLTSVTLPKTIKYIGTNAFSYCSNLREFKAEGVSDLVIAEDMANPSYMRKISISGTNIVIKTSAFQRESSSSGNYRTEGYVNLRGAGIKVGDWAFAYMTEGYIDADLTGVESIGDKAFYKFGSSRYYAYNVADITIKLSSVLKHISQDAFCDLNNQWNSACIAKVIFENEDDFFALPGWGAFFYNHLNSYSNLGLYVVSGEWLGNLVIPDGIRIVPDYALGNAYTPSVYVPESVSSIGDYAFAGCYMTNVVFTSGDVKLGKGVFKSDSFVDLPLPARLMSIPQEMAYQCSYLERLDIPVTVTNIGSLAFGWCKSLTSITIPARVSSIGSSAFYQCTSLASIDFEGRPPSGLKDAELASSIKLRYNEAYASEWIDAIVSCGFTNASPYAPPDSGLSIEGDASAKVLGNDGSGYIIVPDAGTTDVVLVLPASVDPDKVIVEVSPSVETVTPNGASLKIVNGGYYITEYIKLPEADASGSIDFTKAEIADEVKEDAAESAASQVVATEGATEMEIAVKPGLCYGFTSAASLEGLGQVTTAIQTGTSLKVTKGADHKFVKIVISAQPVTR